MLRVAVIAGEISGDLLGGGLITAIRARHPDAEFFGIAGARMLAAGCTGQYPMERLSVMGLFESFGRLAELTPVRNRLARGYIDRPPDVFVGIDAPDFNLPLAAKLRRAGIPVVHYVSPSVWAWRRYRLKKIAKAVDLMLTLFPFEAGLYARHGIPARFVGHPLANRLPDTPDRHRAREQLGLDRDRPVVALMPGSRLMELKQLTAPMLGAAKWLLQRRPRLQLVMPAANETCAAVLRQSLGASPSLPVTLWDGQSVTAMMAADVVLLASGTATLEAMLLQRPMVVTYKTMPLTWMIGRAMLYMPWVSLPNILAGRELVPERLQQDATPEILGAAVLDWLEHPARCRDLGEQFLHIRKSLTRDADNLAAQAVLEVASAG